MLFDVLKHVTEFGKSTLRLGGSIVTTPLSISTNVIDVANQFVRVSSKMSNAVAQKAIKILSKKTNVDGDEHQIGNRDESHRVEDHSKNEEQLLQVKGDHSIEDSHTKEGQQQADDLHQKEEQQQADDHRQKEEKHHEGNEKQYEEEEPHEEKDDHSVEK